MLSGLSQWVWIGGGSEDGSIAENLLVHILKWLKTILKHSFGYGFYFS